MWLIAGSSDHFSCLRPSKYINNGRTGWIFLSLICLQPANLATNSSGGRGGWCRWGGGGGGGGGGVLVSKSANCSHRPAAAAFQPSQCAGTSPGLSCPVLSSLQSPVHLTLSSLLTSHQNYINTADQQWRWEGSPAQWVALYSRFNNSSESRMQVGGWVK